MAMGLSSHRQLNNTAILTGTTTTSSNSNNININNNNNSNNINNIILSTTISQTSPPLNKGTGAATTTTTIATTAAASFTAATANKPYGGSGRSNSSSTSSGSGSGRDNDDDRGGGGGGEGGGGEGRKVGEGNSELVEEPISTENDIHSTMINSTAVASSNSNNYRQISTDLSNDSDATESGMFFFLVYCFLHLFLALSFFCRWYPCKQIQNEFSDNEVNEDLVKITGK